ncbi:MAG TPA: family 16 glycosylhydrolase [Rariglobus sp.]|nr:family 16 glycosylhydrolase [Rariglobus sp.]
MIPPLARLAFLTAVSFSSILLLPAQELTLKQAQELREDTRTAETALSQITQSSADKELLKKVTTAKDAVGRVSAQLDAHIGLLTKIDDPADIYGKGKKYPAIAGVSIGAVDVPVGAKVVHVPVTLDKPTANTVIAYVRVFNGSGGRATPDVTKAVIFRPGDPLTKTIAFSVDGMTEGNTVKAVQPAVPDGAKRLGSGIEITAKDAAVNAAAADTSRPAFTFDPFGDLVYSGTPETIRFDDKGGPNTFTTSLSHGRTQPGNGETGYYGTVNQGVVTRGPEGLILTSRRLEKPIPVGSPATLYPFLASMLSGHRTPETQFKYGSVEWVVKMPNRKGSWPALWLVPTGGWPPEIDVYEGFGYNGSWRFNASLSTNLHGGTNNNRTFTRPAMNMKMSTFGLADTLDTEFHTFAVTVAPEWITMFIDGVETMRYANPFKGENWYPLTNVAVKALPDSAYDDGSGDMILRSLKVWRAE